jgi:mannosyltransferase OCH1-like enzyme
MAIRDVDRPRPLDGMNKIVQGLWIGPALSALEQLSIASFLQNGHEYHLYVYDVPMNVPAGTLIRDAGEILPSSRIFQYREYQSYAGFANFFRYKLLLERGGWWVDSDTVCLKQFDFPEEHVFATEICNELEVINCGAIKTPKGSPAMAYAWDVCQTKKPEQLVWGETGPRLMGEAVRKSSLEGYAKPHYTFCPISYSEWDKVLDPDAEVECREDTYAIHLWNEMWRKAGRDKNERYPEDCFYEQIKGKYLGGQPSLIVNHPLG